MREGAVRDGLLGVCVGDALGVPVEFQRRGKLDADPVVDMRGYGTHMQPPGTWSDDSSLTLCLADCLCDGYSLYEIGQSFLRWIQQGEWTAHGKVFDYGHTTIEALHNLRAGVSPVGAGGRSVNANGNGSLMRILPMAYCFPERESRIKATQDVSCITHAHPRSQMCCVVYVEMACLLLDGLALRDAYTQACRVVQEHYEAKGDTRYTSEFQHMERILSGQIDGISREEVQSSGYVIHTLEAALWCLLRHENYADTVLAAVNLGNDTDTVGAVAGGLAGIAYGWQTIPSAWLDVLARREDILTLAERLEARCRASSDPA